MDEELRKLVLAEKPTFEGARRRYVFPDQARAACGRAAAVWAKQTGKPRHLAMTEACSAYWELWEERKK